MLDVKHNRLDYGLLLVPPEEYVLSRAVATSYTVDLDTLLSIPVALYYAQTLEGQFEGKDLQLIRAIQHTARLLTVYHQEGQVKVPNTAKDIYAYFEDSLAPILPNDAFTSFHPKIWVLRYEHQERPDEILFRLIVLSRNLTFDRSWDVAAFLDGRPGSMPRKLNQPLVDFLAWLNKKKPFPESAGFLDELVRVNFDIPDGFDDYAFHPMGIPDYNVNPIASAESQRLMCLSPFLHKDALNTLWENVEELPQILSRRVELEQFDSDYLADFDCYCLSDLVVDGERLSNAEEGDGEPLEQNLHAKVFLFDDDASTRWFLGSANATKAAFERNVEFMLELTGTAPASRLDRVRKELLGKEETGELFVQFDPDENGPEPTDEQKLRATIRSLEFSLLSARMAGKAQVSDENKDNYDLVVNIDLSKVAIPDSITVWVRPFAPAQDAQLLQPRVANSLRFANISETSISRFLHFVIRVADDQLREFLVCIEIADLPPSRLDNIFKSIINSRDKFFAYLRYLLTEDFPKEDLGRDPGKRRRRHPHDDGWDLEMPLFESLLVAASRNPRRLREAEQAIASLQADNDDNDDNDDKRVIPKDFLSLWAIFKAAISREEANHE